MPRTLAIAMGMVASFATACLVGCSAEGGKVKDPNSIFLNGGGGSGAGGDHGGVSVGEGGLTSQTFFADALPNPNAMSGGNGEMKCGIQRFDLSRLPPVVLVVQDRSGSMRRMANGQLPAAGQNDKWTDVTSALKDSIMTTQDQVLWGLEMFPMPPITVASDPNKCNTASPQVNPMLGNATAIGAALDGNMPPVDVGATPTRDALMLADTYLSSLTTKNSRYVVLATDGLPTCLDKTARGLDTSDVNGAVAAVTASAQAGFPVFVVGIAVDGQAGNTLDQMAVAGGMPQMNGATKYYSTASKADFVAALTKIAGQVASCTFDLNNTPPDPNSVGVTIGTDSVDQDPTNGWSYGAGMKTIVLNGTSCDKLKSGNAMDAMVAFGCPGQPPPK